MRLSSSCFPPLPFENYGPDSFIKSFNEPDPSIRLAGRSPASAEKGGLPFDNFLLATQEKVTRAPQAHESSCFDLEQQGPVKLSAL
jgi:hypothetical protein